MRASAQEWICWLQPQATFPVRWKKRDRLPHNSTLLRLFFPPPPALPPPPPPSSISLPLAPSPPRNLPQAVHLSGLSACFFIWRVATGGSTLADYNSASSHFRFIRAPLSPTPPSASHTHYPRQLPTHLRPPLFSPTFHIFLFRSVQKMWLASPETKKKTPMKYCGCGSV